MLHQFITKFRGVGTLPEQFNTNLSLFYYDTVVRVLFFSFQRLADAKSGLDHSRVTRDH